MFLSAANHLNNNQGIVNQLNVFPVPDGDTGTNMSLTAMAAAAEVNRHITASLGEMSQTAAGAALRGARGNSGVILSQILRGMAKEFKEYDSCSAQVLAKALEGGVKNAYKSVMKPTEGTILTVARESAEFAVKLVKKQRDITIDILMEGVVEAAQKSLAKTPDKLPVLKQAGVVDSGGCGLVYFYEGMLSAISGTIIESAVREEASQSPVTNAGEIDTASILYGYCTEFIVLKNGASPNVSAFTSCIKKMGDSMMVVDDEDIIKVHIHTNNPGTVIEKAIKLGELTKIKIDNMREEHQNILMKEAAEPKNIVSKIAISSEPVFSEPPKKYGFVAICAGDGIAKILHDLGIDEVVKGGQTMNPSTDDILSAVMRVNAETVIVLPNNKNIILAANQAKEICEKNILVIESKTVPQGISAMYAFSEECDETENEENMKVAISHVKSESVTFAVRDTTADGKDIKQGDILGMSEGKISVVGQNPKEVCLALIANNLDGNSEIITVFCGEDIENADIENLQSELSTLYSDKEVMVLSGGQPLYYYIISIE